MKVLIVPEDPTYDQYVLKPVVERMFKDLERPARVQVLWNPRLRGVVQALDRRVIADVIESYPMVDLVLVLVDRDGDERLRPAQARSLEEEHDGQLIVCLAIEEVEVWMLAIHRDKLATSWPELRAEVQLKERFAAPFLAEHAPRLGPGEGRKWAMRPLGLQWQGVLRVCPELAELKLRIASWMEA